MNNALAMKTKTQDERKPVFTILLVEDAIAEQSVLTAILRKQGYAVVAVANGIEALEQLNKHHIDLILSDWKMPIMDGFTLCQKVHENTEFAPYFILLTGQDSKCDLVAAMDAGADDFITKPYNSEELRARLQAGERVMTMRKALQQKNLVIEQTLDRETRVIKQLQSDMLAAEKLQRSLLPCQSNPLRGVSLAHYFRASNGVAGDTFNVIPLDQDHLAFYHIDVAGHGVRAAMHSFNISRQLSDPNQISKLRQYEDTSGAFSFTAPSKVIADLNKDFDSNEDCSDYYTMIYGVLNLQSGQGIFSQAGMPLPLLIESSSKARFLGEGGFPVGMLENATYNDHLFTLNQGERLVLYSDGILSCKLSSGQELSQSRFAKIFQKLSEVGIEKLHKKIPGIFQNIIQENSFEDDISIMIIERDTPLKELTKIENMNLQRSQFIQHPQSKLTSANA